MKTKTTRDPTPKHPLIQQRKPPDWDSPSVTHLNECRESEKGLDPPEDRPTQVNKEIVVLEVRGKRKGHRGGVGVRVNHSY